jgi:drug/metabolite transporter (DMT)-like permease
MCCAIAESDSDTVISFSSWARSRVRSGTSIPAGISREMPGSEVISWILVISLPATVPAALWLMPENLHAVSAAAWWSLGYVALFSMYIGFFAWNAGLALAGVANASQMQLLQTFLTIGLAALINREGIDLVTAAAAVAVVMMVALGQRARSR